MNKVVKIILILALVSLVFVVASTFFLSPKQGSILEMLTLIAVVPVIIGAVLLFKLRSDITIHPFLRTVGFVIFLLWIFSFLIDNPFRE